MGELRVRTSGNSCKQQLPGRIRGALLIVRAGTRIAQEGLQVKTPLLLLAVSGAIFSSALAPAQSSPPDRQSQEQVAALLKQVRAQQEELVANQAKIEEKLAALAEAIRQARIYSSRAGR